MAPQDTLMDGSIKDPLPGLCQRLAREFDGAVPREVIDQAAQEALEELDDARIREFVPIFAWRTARASLRTTLVASSSP